MRLTHWMSLAVLMLLVFSALPVSAQAAQDEGYRHRLELAKKMHELRPTKDQVYEAIDRVAENQPEAERETFVAAMRNVLNYRAIENISVEAMAETYTEAELQAMVEYYSRPEAISAAAKDAEYSQKVYPEIIRMLDQAMMRVRTGAQ